MGWYNKHSWLLWNIKLRLHIYLLYAIPSTIFGRRLCPAGIAEPSRIYLSLVLSCGFWCMHLSISKDHYRGMCSASHCSSAARQRLTSLPRAL